MIAVTRNIATTFAFAGLIALAACQDATSPIAGQKAFSPAHSSSLLAPGEFSRGILDSTDANGNTTFITEYAAGVTLGTADVPSTSVASVTIRTFIPNASSSSSKDVCITSTIDHVDVSTGWTYSIKKSGGCNKTIEVLFENASTKQKADFQFLMEPGKTRIDAGLIQ